jgi:hypothetical protein
LIPYIDSSFEKAPWMPRSHGQPCFLASPHKFCEVWLVSGTLAWVVDRHPDPGQACYWSKPPQASLDLRTYFFFYTSRVSALPLFHLFCALPIAALPIPFDQSLLYGLLISLFSALYTGSWLSSTSSQAAQIIKRVCFYTFA